MTERRGRGRPRNPEADHAVLTQTLRLLTEGGYGAMSVDSVAAAAGVSKATLYRRYRDKRELVVAALSLLRHEAPAVPDTGDIERDVVAAIGDMVRYFRRMNGFALVGAMLAEASGNPEFLKLFREHVILPRRASLHGRLERGVERGELHGGMDIEAAIDCIAGSVFARHLRGLPTDRRWVRSVVRTMLEGMHPRGARPHHLLVGLRPRGS